MSDDPRTPLTPTPATPHAPHERAPSMRSSTPYDEGAPARPHALSPLYGLVAREFEGLMGSPTRVAGTNLYWSLHRKDMLWDINVLLKDAESFPIVWIFDPHDRDNGVVSHVIKTAAEIELIVADIKARTKHAGDPGR